MPTPVVTNNPAANASGGNFNNGVEYSPDMVNDNRIRVIIPNSMTKLRSNRAFGILASPLVRFISSSLSGKAKRLFD
jgi:hypothetical protein